MKHPKLTTKVKHSESKSAWNIIGNMAGAKYKIARVPYLISDSEILNTREKAEALEHAMFINFCFNNPDKVKLP
jgi:hypothetical protein